MSNLRQLGIALQLYSDDFDEKYPPDLRFLYNKYATDLELYVCPSSGKKKATGVVPTNYETGKPADIPAECMSYCYVAGLTTADPPDYILAFDEDTNHNRDAVNVLYIGQNVIWQSEIKGKVQVQLKKQEEELRVQGREMKIIHPSGENK